MLIVSSKPNRRRQMQRSVFKELCVCIRKAWTPKDGVILRLLRGSEHEKELLLCVGGHRNPAICARYCVVWDGDEKVYDGEIMSDKLQHLLTKSNICFVEITNARLMEHNRHGVYKCLKAAEGCKRQCTLVKAARLEVSPGLAVAIA